CRGARHGDQLAAVGRELHPVVGDQLRVLDAPDLFLNGWVPEDDAAGLNMDGEERAVAPHPQPAERAEMGKLRRAGFFELREVPAIDAVLPPDHKHLAVTRNAGEWVRVVTGAPAGRRVRRETGNADEPATLNHDKGRAVRREADPAGRRAN